MSSQTVLRQFLFLLVINFSSIGSNGFKMLLLPLPTKSHLFSLTVIGQQLVKRGHEVHMLVDSDFPLSEELTSNSSQIILHRYGSAGENKLDFDEMTSRVTQNLMKSKLEKEEDKVIQTSMLWFRNNQTHRLLMNNDKLIETLQGIHFHMAVVDKLFFMKFFYLIPHRIGIPWVTYTDLIAPWLVRVPWLPSYVPLKMSSFTDNLNFLERLQNTLFTIMFAVVNVIPDPPEEIVGQYRKYGAFKSMDDLTSKSLFYISTDDVVMDYPQPQMPNMIHAGGLTVKPAIPDSLPAEFRTFIGGSREGAIIVSFGSMASNFPDDIAKRFIDTFSRLLDYRFIWRFENKHSLIIPKNVMLSKWLPQNDLLAHPRVKLFITHCGNNGQFESMYHGVPMIGFPLLGDQHFNARKIEYRGYGIPMDIREFSADELTANVLKILGDVSYKKRVTLASDIFRSALQSPGERAAYWIEHVTKFGGDHLKSAGNELSILQYWMLDILAVLFVGFSFAAYCFYTVFRLILRRLFGHRPSASIEAKQKKTD